jgi:hypothetical protein
MFCQPMLCRQMIRRLALGSPYSKPSTAEDSLRTPARCLTPCRSILRQYSRGARPTQRGCWSLSCQAVDSLVAWCGIEYVRVPKSCERHSPGDNNAHIGQSALTTTEARISQRNPEAGSDRPLESHIPGNGIPRKSGSKRNWQGESQKTSWTGPL